MDNKLKMVGLTRNNSTWAYVRAIPTSLKSHPSFRGKKNYRRQLVPIDTPRDELLKVWEKAHNDFEQYIADVKLLNTSVIEQNKLIEQAERFLRINGLKPSMLASVSQDDSPATQYEKMTLPDAIEQTGIFDKLSEYSAKSGYEQAFSNQFIKDDLPAELIVQDFAWKLLHEPPKDSYKTYILSDCWAEYVAKKGIDADSRAGKRIKACYFRFIKLVGDHIIDEMAVNDSLVKYVENREQQRLDNQAKGDKASPSPATIARELNTLMAIIRVACKRFRVIVRLERPEIRDDVKARERHTFTTQEQIDLIHIASDQARSDYQPYKELMILLMIQTGTHVTELIRLKKDKVILKNDIPHIILDGELKTNQRKRVIPLVFRVDRIRELADLFHDDSDYFFGRENSQRTADNYSAQLNKLCREVHADSTSYSCRHAFKHLAYAKGIDAQVLAILGGWSGKEAGLSRQMQGYGKSGLMNIESLKRLRIAVHSINEHLIELDKNENSNVYYIA
nr:tyrosine-type recombinase/integrase [uncultured Methylophaga sp.]